MIDINQIEELHNVPSNTKVMFKKLKMKPKRLSPSLA